MIELQMRLNRDVGRKIWAYTHYDYLKEIEIAAPDEAKYALEAMEEGKQCADSVGKILLNAIAPAFPQDKEVILRLTAEESV